MLPKYTKYLCTASLVLTLVFTLLCILHYHREMPSKAKVSAMLLLGLAAFVYYRLVYAEEDGLHKGLLCSLGIHLLVFVVCVVGAKLGGYKP
jgi:uncharacterized membrane protein YGL010W